ncbi:Nickel-dependent hydrogenase [Mesorhizobium albiziae]|uniref:Nickel-dependent hydrogenase n=1 Tax=Neomesorhizobium albiziae TaxID=335020 RepID=A0A1I4FCF6_9HYPH|nr:nickel-dependent hydrogenase large subunit [Mesorhizobium albiziae]GLS30865.1 hydrogenase expression/formation protein HupK [Mesorhizobium albiziae]SFL15608.1 Nickel-dependent hydrogenase [Mesorhizobium albiziae]
MTFLLGAGTIRIDVTVSRALACSVAVKANRPQGLTRMFVGRRPEEAPPLAGQVFSLCGFAQSVAARLAVLNAADMAMKVDERIGSGAGLLAERIFETLRALILHWPCPLPASLGATAGRHLREALAASQEIIAAAKAGQIDRAHLAAAAARLSAAASALGIPSQGDTPLPESACAAMLQDIGDDRVFNGRRPDPLTINDDPEVIARLCDEPGYASLPHLQGRVAETGAYARLAADDVEASHLVQRLLARINDARLCLKHLTALAATGKYDGASLACGGATPGAGGYGAVECARGRLYHQAEIGGDGRLSSYRILAPTEWNFHPAGPFVETLLSSPVGTDEAAVRSVSRLAVLFDPCVAFEVNVREAAHA